MFWNALTLDVPKIVKDGRLEEEVLRLVAKGAFDKKSPAWLALPREARDREFSGKITEILGLWIDRAGNDGNKSCIHIS